jgi:heme-binding uptake protein ChaN (Tiki superfamily)
MVAVMTVAGAGLVTLCLTTESPLRAQSPQIAARPHWRLPGEAAGVEGIVRALISVFDQADIVALGEAHDRKVDSDLRIALIRDPDFARKVRFIVVEFGSTTEQSTLDRYVRGENVSAAQLAQVWKTTTQAANGVWDDPVYADFFAAVRDVNSRLPADGRIRVFGGDPGPGDTRSRDGAAVSILRAQVLQRHGKALVVYGAAHFYRTEVDQVLRGVGGGIARTLDAEYPGRTLSVIPVGGRLDPPPGATLRVYPDYQKFDRALRTQVRPVLVPLQRLPFRDFSAEEFLGGGLFNCRGPGGCRSALQGSNLTLGQMADALIYLGGGENVDTKAKPAR